MTKFLFYFFLLFCFCKPNAFAQEDYQAKKAKALLVESPFTKIVKRELPATIEYEDDEIIAFIPIKTQAKVHILIVPKKRIPTINDLTPVDSALVGKLFLVAQKLAQQKGIAESGYRLVINTNQDSGQSVFHLHLHLLGGENVGGMINVQKE